jgi:hypothetical protein
MWPEVLTGTGLPFACDTSLDPMKVMFPNLFSALIPTEYMAQDKGFSIGARSEL